MYQPLSSDEDQEHRIPVHVIFSDDVNRKQALEVTTLPSQDQESSTTIYNENTTPIETAEVTKQTPEAAESDRSYINIGDSDASIREEPKDPDSGVRHEYAEVRQIARNAQVKVKSPIEIFKPQDKSKNKDNPEKKHVEYEEKTKSEERTTTQTPQLFTNRQFPSPFENPILTFLAKQQALERDGNQVENNLQNKPQQQNIRREVFHQQTIVNPNPYMQQFLQQMQQASQPQQFTQLQQANQPQQFTQQLQQPQQFNYQLPLFPPTITNFQQPQQPYPTQNYPVLPDSNRAELPQMPGNTDKGGNMVTTLTLYPAIASVSYTAPANYQPTQSNTQSLPNTRFVQPLNRASWPLADYFPIVIKDPFLTMYHMMTNMVEYGPEADVCKKSKSFRQGRSKPEDSEDEEEAGTVVVMENGGWKILGKEERLTARKVPEEDRKKNDGPSEIVMETGGNGNAGPYITRLMVRKGGVSIAGPGGIATAGSGGTAIVGPGGVAYTSPNGLAVVGPGGKVVGVPSGTDLSLIASQVNNPAELNKEGSTPRLLNIPPGGRVVAVGPTVYYHQPE